MSKEKEHIEGKINIAKEVKRLSRKTFKDVPMTKIMNDNFSREKVKKKIQENDLDWEEIEEMIRIEEEF